MKLQYVIFKGHFSCLLCDVIDIPQHQVVLSPFVTFMSCVRTAECIEFLFLQFQPTLFISTGLLPPKTRTGLYAVNFLIEFSMLAFFCVICRTVVRINIGKSQGLYSSFTRRSSEHNYGLLTVGLVDIDIPQHPVILHGMVARSSKRLSTTLQEFIRMPPTPRPR